MRNKPLSVQVTTECGHCHQPLHIQIDSELRFQVLDEAGQPLVYVPVVDFNKLQDPSIIDAF